MLHTMKLGHEPFTAIQEGRKTIETRLFDEKRQKLSIGDEILFSDTDASETSLRVRVVGLTRYATFQELFAARDTQPFGGERGKMQLLDQVRTFYSAADEAKYGVLAIEFVLAR